MSKVLVLNVVENMRRLRITREIAVDDGAGGLKWMKVEERARTIMSGSASLQEISNTHQRVVVEVLEDEPPPAKLGWLDTVKKGIARK